MECAGDNEMKRSTRQRRIRSRARRRGSEEGRRCTRSRSHLEEHALGADLAGLVEGELRTGLVALPVRGWLLLSDESIHEHIHAVREHIHAVQAATSVAICKRFTQ